MADEETLVQAVLDSPGDEPALDALASFLEERDDPRGELLRGVVEAARRAGSAQPLAGMAERIAATCGSPRWDGSLIKRVTEVRWGDLAGTFVPSALIHARSLADDLAPGLAMAAVYQSVHDPATWLGDDGARRLAEDPSAASLRSLDLERHRIGPDGIRALAGSPHLAGLVELTLTGNPVGDEGLEALAASPYLRRLEVLKLKECGVRPKGLASLLASPHAQRLMELDVTGGSVPWVAGAFILEAEGARVLAAANMPRLRALYAASQWIGVEGAQALAASPLLRQLRWLDLSNNGLGLEGLRALAASPHLKPGLMLGTGQNHVEGGEWRQYTDWDGSVVSEGYEDVSARPQGLAGKGIVFPPGVQIH